MNLVAPAQIPNPTPSASALMTPTLPEQVRSIQAHIELCSLLVHLAAFEYVCEFSSIACVTMTLILGTGSVSLDFMAAAQISMSRRHSRRHQDVH